MDQRGDQPKTVRSTFVSVVAWIAIAIGGFSTLMGVLQSIMFYVMFRSGLFPTQMPESDPHLPVLARFMFEHIQWISLTILIVSVVILTAGIGLLMRRDWARRLFIALLVGAILWNIGGVVIQYLFFSSMPDVPSSAPPDFQSGFEAVRLAIAIFSAILSLAVSVLFAWIAKRLLSPMIKAEFSGWA